MIATFRGLAQCAELCWQLRGQANKRQVPNAKVALQHNLGLGGAVVITLYRHGFPAAMSPRQIQAQTVSASSESDFKAKAVFDEVTKALKEDGANLVKKIKGVYCFKVKTNDGKEGVWVVDVKNGTGSVKFDCKDKADTTIIMKDDDLVSLMMGKMNPQNAFFQGKLKITGNMALAMKLKDIQPKAGGGAKL